MSSSNLKTNFYFNSHPTSSILPTYTFSNHFSNFILTDFAVGDWVLAKENSFVYNKKRKLYLYVYN
jgi:hypothetical protein